MVEEDHEREKWSDTPSSAEEDAFKFQSDSGRATKKTWVEQRQTRGSSFKCLIVGLL